tara:strand:- start:1012 stop:1191 length:180 start_codon:yes stop_codon:yes gene_type:complete
MYDLPNLRRPTPQSEALPQMPGRRHGNRIQKPELLQPHGERPRIAQNVSGPGEAQKKTS